MSIHPDSDMTEVTREELIAVLTANADEKRRLRNRKAASRRRQRDAAMRDVGMVKVKGATSGRTYWE